MRKNMNLAALAIVALATGGVAQASTIVQSGDWNTPSTWSGPVPTFGENVTINGGFTATVGSNATGSYTTLYNGGTLALGAGNLTLNNQLRIGMDGNGVGSLIRTGSGSFHAVNDWLRIGGTASAQLGAGDIVDSGFGMYGTSTATTVVGGSVVTGFTADND